MTIQSFKLNIPQAALDDLQYRLAHAQFPDQLPHEGWTQGVPLDYLKKLVEYWRTNYDWRKQEARLNVFPQFTTEIDGQTIHFLHVRSPEPDAMPLLMLHGYPSSIVEFMEIIQPLTNPRAHGGNPKDAFHIVAPSLPGFGFSIPIKQAEWEIHRTAKAFAELMNRLGYQRYFAHGGDIGAGVTGEFGTYAPDNIVAVHVNTDPTAIALIGMPIADPNDDPTLSEGEKARMNDLRAYQAAGTGYLQIQTTRPQTLGYALADSPVGQLAWIVEKFKEWMNISAELPEDAYDMDQLLTNVSLYWFTRTGISAAGFIYEAAHSKHPWSPQTSTPTGFAAFNIKNVEKAMRKMVDPENQIEHWSNYDQGGHFPEMEAPDLVIADLRKFFQRYR
jgi:epoxide hydrolase